MEGYFDRIKNYNVSVKEVNKNIIFIRELKPGGIEHSFGIQVAKMAGMPKKILENANNMLIELENKNYKKTIKTSQKRTGNLNRDMQLSFVKLDDPILEELRDQLLGIDINNLTPMDAFMKLNKIKKLLDT
jgi:DNA mismatch repair protein MutS